MAMEWTREKTLALINEYRKRRGLWDMTHDDYRKKDVKQNLLAEVSSSLGGNIAVGEIEKKFHTLRTQYHREINRMKRKEPYNSKWFGFKNLQFLSSPTARRLSRGRIKNEITEDGTVTSKYIIRQVTTQQHENSVCSSNNVNDEYLTPHQKPTLTIETVSHSRRNISRTRALEKLIEETTKDIEDIDDKGKMSISIPHGNYNGQIHTEEEPQHPQNNEEPQPINQISQPLETIQLQGDDEEEINYPQTTGESGSHNETIHHGVSARIIKIRRRDTCDEAEFYEDDSEHQHENKRIFYETGVQQHCGTIVASSPSPTINPNNTGITFSKVKSRPTQRQHEVQEHNLGGTSNTKSLAPMVHARGTRDEFTTYGEYVSNEMRNITNREVLLSLKHKINTALFEAQMAELQKKNK